MAIPLDEIKFPTGPILQLFPSQLDSLLTPVIASKQISLFHGISRAPLTSLAHIIVVAGAKRGKKAVFLDSGKNYSPNLARKISTRITDDVLERVLVADILSLQDLDDAIPTLLDIDQLNVVVLDSLTGVLNLSGAPGSKSRQRKLFATLEILRNLVNNSGAHLMITDHSSRNWSTGELQPIGGNVLSHDVDSVVRVTRLESMKEMLNIVIERSPHGIPDAGIIVRLGPTGLKSIRNR